METCDHRDWNESNLGTVSSSLQADKLSRISGVELCFRLRPDIVFLNFAFLLRQSFRGNECAF
jgi:hypothetical protein